ncbi:1-(5-phosphoribosyl)-5-[(5-phosphoribosylamino)methylideneamino]imidazole-4-carboxamide isomerase [Laceyella putida]|uniref:1-(5-phosphoribosyl)-5-[(5-phosphoribosylamino)methylideneamino] imidazole-4-carboxamide isomerase n=1 Tax=Laceyella putida TaxID=110101 RepID=A0ABW2RG33_9BACL
MAFTLYPAIDIRGGKCVRLIQGDYGQETVYGNQPLDVLRRFVGAGAEWVHVVDLDAARTGEMTNFPLICELIKESPVPIQVGGGVRDETSLERLLNAGAARVVIGSAAIEQPAFVKAALKRVGSKLAIGLDARGGMIATHGWLRTQTVTAAELAQEMAEHGAETFIFTDIERDGMLTGTNIRAVRDLARATGKAVIASGGVSSLAELDELAGYQGEGIAGAIIGKAIYTGAIRLEEALSRTQGG